MDEPSRADLVALVQRIKARRRASGMLTKEDCTALVLVDWFRAAKGWEDDARDEEGQNTKRL